MNRSELNKILEEHKKWLMTAGEEGKRADLGSADLNYADLRYNALQQREYPERTQATEIAKVGK